MIRTITIQQIFVVLFLFQFVFNCELSANIKGELFKKRPFIIKSSIYLGNLEGQIDNLRLKAGYLESDVTTRVSLSKALYKKSFYTGNLIEVQEALNQLYIALKLAKNDRSNLRDIYLLKAIQELSLHRFKQAEISLKLAMKNGALEKDTASIKADLDWNYGRYPQAIVYYENDAKLNPNMHSIMRLAILKHQLGNFDQANDLYQKSISMFNGANPVVYSWLIFQFGVHKLRLNQLEQAKLIFIKSLSICPKYISALEHLAETEAKLGNTSESIDLYEKVVKLSDNPEFKAQLSYLYKKIGKSKKAYTLLHRAQKDYELRLLEYPNTMGAHASSFFLKKNEGEIALRLLQANVKLRPNSESYVSLSEVQVHLEMAKSAEKNLRKALNMPLVSQKLCDLSKQLKIEKSRIPKTCIKF